MFGKKKNVNQLEMKELMDVANGAQRVAEASHRLLGLLNQIKEGQIQRTEETHNEIEKILDFIEKHLDQEIEALHEAKRSERKGKIIKIQT